MTNDENNNNRNNNNEWPTAKSIESKIKNDIDEIKRSVIVEDFKVSVRYIIYALLTCAEGSYLYESSLGVTRLCMSIEMILVHDTTDQFNGLWNLLKSINHHSNHTLISVDELADISHFPQLLTDLGRSRAFIRSILNNNKLSLLFNQISKFTILNNNKEEEVGEGNEILEIQKQYLNYYNPSSIMRSQPDLEILEKLFEKIDGTKFSLILNSSTFDTLIDHRELEKIDKGQDKIENNNFNINNVNNNSKNNEDQDSMISQFDNPDLEKIPIGIVLSNYNSNIKKIFESTEIKGNNNISTTTTTKTIVKKSKYKLEEEEEVEIKKEDEGTLSFSDLLDKSFQSTFKTNAFKSEMDINNNNNDLIFPTPDNIVNFKRINDDIENDFSDINFTNLKINYHDDEEEDDEGIYIPEFDYSKSNNLDSKTTTAKKKIIVKKKVVKKISSSSSRPTPNKPLERNIEF
eukprot:gene3750-4669_t